MENVIPLITNPLALAALAILVLGVALQGARVQRHVSARVFWIILILAILGNAGYFFSYFIAKDAIVRGQVKDNAGAELSQAVIDIEGVARTASFDNGQFELSIPYSRTAKEYKITVKYFGYESKTTVVSGPYPEFQSIVLNKKQISADDVVDMHDNLGITQNVGDPAISINFRIKKQFPSDVRFSLYQVDLDDGDGEVTTLYPTFIQINGQPAPMYLAGVNLKDPLVNAEVLVLFEKSQFARQAIQQQLVLQVGPMWWQTECTRKEGLGDTAFDALRSYFQAAFWWKDKKYTMTVSFRVNDESGKYKRAFAINKKEMDRLKSVENKIRKCAGVAFDMNQIVNLSYSDWESSNFMFKSSNSVPIASP